MLAETKTLGATSATLISGRRRIHSWLIFLGVALNTLIATEPNHEKTSTFQITELNFDRYEIQTEPAVRQSILTGFLFGNSQCELIISKYDERGIPLMQLFTFSEDNWKHTHTIPYPKDIEWIDIINIAGRDRLLCYGSATLKGFDPKTQSFQNLHSVACSFKPPHNPDIPHVDISHDINNDNLDDIVIPIQDGFSVKVQLPNGMFSKTIKIHSSPTFEGIYGTDGYHFDPWKESRMFPIDYNNDGLQDLIYWDKDSFAVKIQNAHLLFQEGKISFPSPTSFASANLYSLANGEMKGRRLHSIVDVNSDNISDLIIYSLSGNSIADKTSRYEIHYGQRNVDQTLSFEEKVGRTYHSTENPQFSLNTHDFNNDNKQDILISSIDRKHLTNNLWKRLKGFMGDDVWITLEFYPANKNFSSKPARTIKIPLDGIPSFKEPGYVPFPILLQGATHKAKRTRTIWPNAFNSILMIGDLNHDNYSDLIVGQHPMFLDLFIGNSADKLFSTKSQQIAVEIPNDGENACLVDLNRDDKKDIILHNPFPTRDAHGTPLKKPGVEAHKITLFISK